jgi:hypothetical protein
MTGEACNEQVLETNEFVIQNRIPGFNDHVIAAHDFPRLARRRPVVLPILAFARKRGSPHPVAGRIYGAETCNCLEVTE